MISNTRLKVVRGEDERFVLKLRTKSQQDPLDLSSATKISISLIKSNRTEIVLTNEVLVAQKAKTKVWQVTFTALTPGVNGNNIQLDFDGIKTVQEIVDEWNIANPTNTIGHDGTGSTKLTGGLYTLSGGLPAYQAIEVVDSPILGRIKVTLLDTHTNQLRLGLNQSLTIKVDFGVHPTGNRVIAQLKNFLDVVEAIS